MTTEDPKHRRFINRLPCAACGRSGPSECAHVRLRTFGDAAVPFHDQGGTGLKPSDAYTVPLCQQCHALQHRGERSFWVQRNRNPIWLAEALKRNTGNLSAARAIVLRMGEAL